MCAPLLVVTLSASNTASHTTDSPTHFTKFTHFASLEKPSRSSSLKIYFKAFRIFLTITLNSPFSRFCSARLSELQRVIVDYHRKSNVTAPKPHNTALQKALFKRVSGWWEKPKPIVKVFNKEDVEAAELVGGLPDSLEVVNDDFSYEDQAAGSDPSANRGLSDDDWRVD
jgi:hypothetical protein